MVSKKMKKTPIKSLKDCRRTPSRNRKKTPLKSTTATASVVIATINESFFTCRRRLVKIFSKLVKITTPKRKSPKKQGFIKLKKTTMLEISKPLFFGLPPIQNPNQKTVFLDLDETLIHSSADPPPEKYDFIVRPVIDGEVMNFYVLKRPGVDQLLEFLSGKFEVVVFTAGLREYASLLLDILDKNGVISHRLYRDSCREIEGKFVKDLSQMGRDLWKVVIVDDNPSSYAFQPENAIQIKPFVDDLDDDELTKLIRFFEDCDGVKDIRDAVKSFGGLKETQMNLLEF
ncbi:uncharacterized protein LOC141592839 [Silene latifolia]|uniref:uncharacterized protein LOC141592839 n=1 Tax=Silene latifolia TaxID=37657 RepID=UPI003D76FEE7